MRIRFDQLSGAPARALQIYLILIGCAANQQTITYAKLAQRVGLLTPSSLFVSLGHLSEWCLHEGLAPLTALAIAEDTGAPGPLPLEIPCGTAKPRAQVRLVFHRPAGCSRSRTNPPRRC